METIPAGPNEHMVTRSWFNDYLSQSHHEIGRKGNVCPFVRSALNANTIILETFSYDPASDRLESLCSLMRYQLKRFLSMKWPDGKAGIATLVTIIENFSQEHGILLDEAQRRVKAEAVRNGLMIGQFHPTCAEPAVLNPSFQVSRSPEPLFAIRHMAMHDILFLHTDQDMFAEYQKRFSHLYDDSNTKIPEVYANLYSLALNRGKGRGAYIDYQHIDILLSLQHPHTDHPAEMSFYLCGQAKELLFKLIYEQARAVRIELASDNIEKATSGLGRISITLEVLTRVWDILSTLTPKEFNSFRKQLGEASGIDSYMYRMTEFILGCKSELLASRFLSHPGIAEEVYRALHETSVYDEVLLYLNRHGLINIDKEDSFEKDSETIINGWSSIYRKFDSSHSVFRLAESLMDVAQNFSRWRQLHLITVERMIGINSGTGGTEGLSWLKHAADHHFFSELWVARTKLSSE